MGIYIVLDGNRNADHVFCRWRAAGGSADCRNHACFLSVVFLLIARGICEEDIKALPNGEKITKRLEKYLQKTGG